MSRVKVIQAEATTNLCTNPSFEKNLTGWTLGVGTPPAAVRSSLYQARGAWSMKVTFLDALMQYAGFGFTPTPGATYTGTVKVYVETVAQAGSLASWFGGGTNPPVDVALIPGWNDVELTYVAADATPILFIAAYNYKAPYGAGKAGVVYVDAIQIEQKDHSTSYCDGDQLGCEWVATPHGSKSSRAASERSGGVWVDLDDDLGFKYSEVGGVGMPPLTHVTLDQALREGVQLQRIKSNPTLITLVATMAGQTLPELHALRRALLDVLKADAVPTLQPIRLQYSGSDEE